VIGWSFMKFTTLRAGISELGGGSSIQVGEKNSILFFFPPVDWGLPIIRLAFRYAEAGLDSTPFSKNLSKPGPANPDALKIQHDLNLLLLPPLRAREQPLGSGPENHPNHPLAKDRCPLPPRRCWRLPCPVCLSQKSNPDIWWNAACRGLGRAKKSPCAPLNSLRDKGPHP